MESVLAQTIAPDNIVIVDDGSTDDSAAVVERLAVSNAGITLVRLPGNSGAPTARNVGARHAAGDILAFLDSDDAWLPGKTASQLAMFAAHPGAPAVFTATLVSHVDGRRSVETVPPSVCRTDLFERNVLGGTSSAMIRRSAFDAVGGFLPDMPSCQDWDLWLRLAVLGPLAVCQAPLTIHHLHAGNRITADPERVISGQRRITALLRPEIAERDLPGIVAAHDFNVASILVGQAGKPWLAVSFTLRAWIRLPTAASSVRAARLLAKAMFGTLRWRA